MFDPKNNNFYNALLNQNSLGNNYPDTQLGNNYPDMQGYQVPPSTYSNFYSPNDLVNNNNVNNNLYAEGGEVRKPKKQKEERSPYAILAEMIRQQGGEEDVVLAHINPLEERMLATLSGGRKINPKTGLPQYGFFNKPGKWFKSIAGGIGGAVLGNLIMPGVGGIIGGALGNAAGEAARGRKNYGSAALKGAGIGAGLPSLASALGSGANALGANSVGGYLSNYGNQNAIFPALERFTGSSFGNTAASSPANFLAPVVNSTPSFNPTASSALGGTTASAAGNAADQGFIESLIGNTKTFLTDPKNLLTTGVLASSFLNRPKKETPESKARDQKRYENALMLTPEELRQKEAYLLAEEQMKRRIQRNKFLPEERLNIDPVYLRTSDPEEYKKTRKWLNYYNNPEFSGAPLVMKKGGSVPDTKMMEIEAVSYSPKDIGYYLQGITGGQDDKVPALLSDGEFVIPTDVVSDLGDGNNAAGANKFEQLILNVRRHKRGGSTKLPPKAKPLSNYMR